MNQSPWAKFARKHQRSFTCANEAGELVHEPHKQQLQMDPKWIPSDTISLEDRNSNVVVGKRKRIQTEHFDEIKDEKQNGVRASFPKRTSIARGYITDRNNRDQKSQRTARDLSRDLEKAQRILEIDHDILKSQMKNLNSQYKAKRQNLESQNKLLIEKIHFLESVAMEDRKELLKFKEVLENTVSQFAQKFDQQAYLNDLYTREIHTLKGIVRVFEINNKAAHVLDRSNSRRDASPPPRRQTEDFQKQKFIERIKLLEFELSTKNKQLKQYEKSLPESHQNIKNSGASVIHESYSFSQTGKAKQQIAESCQQISNIFKIFVGRKINNPSALDLLSQKLQQSVEAFKQVIEKDSDPHIKSQISSCQMNEGTPRRSLEEVQQN